MISTKKKNLLRWCGWFFGANTLFFLLISLNYYPNFLPIASHDFTYQGLALITVYALLASAGYFALLAVCCISCVAIFILICPWPRMVALLAIALAMAMCLFLLADTIVYDLYRFHLNGVLFKLVVHGSANELLSLSPHEWLACLVTSFLLLVIECWLAYGLWYSIILPATAKGFGKWWWLALTLCLYLSYAMIVFSDGFAMHRLLINSTRYLPFYDYWLAYALPGKNNLIALAREQERFFVQPEQSNKHLNYPLSPLQCLPTQQPLNVVMIVIDAWRFDALQTSRMPTVSAFAKRSWLFTHHRSGGNATGPGIFSLFYSLPATYWTAMLNQQRAPVFIEALQAQQYMLGIYSSAPLRMPAFDKTVFQSVLHLQTDTPGNDPLARDRQITQQFSQFAVQAAQQSKPFFSFLFYDSAHSYCSIDNLHQPFSSIVDDCARYKLTNDTAPLPYFNRYRNALFFIDQQIKKVFATLNRLHLADHTVVIITGDHGEEFNDNHLNYWGHASNFTRYQLNTPLIIHWPHETARVFTHATSHYDIVPTLLRTVLKCDTPMHNYSIGKRLLQNKPSAYFLASSYVGFGIIEPQCITTVYASGAYSIDTNSAQNLPTAQLNTVRLQQAFTDMNRFYKK